DVVALDGVSAVCLQQNAVAETSNREALDRAAAGSDLQAGTIVGPRGDGIQLNQGATGIVGLGRPVDHDRVGDNGQWGGVCHLDGLNAAARDVEVDGVGALVGVGVHNRLVQRARAAIVGVRDCESGQ